MLLQDLIFKIGEKDAGILHNTPKDLTFKLVRDTRFSHDKSPYNPAFAEHFEVKGTSLKNVPKKYFTDCAAAKYLKYKSWYIEYPVEDSRLCDLPSFVDFTGEKFLQMKPFNDFLNRALIEFNMPAR